MIGDFITKLFVGVFVAVTFTGCRHTYEQVPAANLSRPKLDANAKIYVPIPPDARYKKQLAMDSGQMTAAAVRDAFGKYAKRAYVGRRIESFAESVETARRNDCAYVVYATVLRWEDRATEFSGRMDKIEIRIDLADAQSGAVLHSTLVKGRSRWLSDGGDKPQDLLKEPIADYAASLFQTIHVPSALQ